MNEQILSLVYAALILAVSILLCILLCGFFQYNRLEAKKCKWIKESIRPKRKKGSEEESVRKMVSLQNGMVMFADFYFERDEWSIDGVEAWRDVPPSYIDLKKYCSSLYKKLFKI